jgi:hypothetical protein
MNSETDLTDESIVMTNVESTTNIPALLTPSSLTDDCIICYEPLNKESGCVTTKCGHKYCPACFVAHMNIDNKCAMCRTEIPMKKPESMKDRISSMVEMFSPDDLSDLVAELSNNLRDSGSMDAVTEMFTTSGLSRIIMGDTEFDNQARIHVPAFPQRFPTQEVLNTNRGSGRVPFSVPMSVMIREEEQMRREREELVRNGRTGGHWGVPWNRHGEEEIIS